MRVKYYPMNVCLRVIWRPICLLVILGLSSFMISRLYLLNKQTEESIIAWESSKIQESSSLGIEMTAKLLSPLNSSAMNLASALSSSLNETELSFDTIKEKVAPALFLAVSTIPHLAQATYIGIDGLMFSIYRGETQMIASYNNISYSSIWYSQQVDRDSGNLYGEPIFTKSNSARNSTWFQKALNSSSGYSWFGKAWNKAQDGLFLSAMAMDGRGVISLGLRAKAVADHFAVLEFHDADFQLATHDGEVIIPTRLPNTQITVSNNTKLKPNGDPYIDLVGNLSCSMSHGGGSKYYTEKVSGVTYKFYCSTLEIAGVQTVYALVYPTENLVSLVRHYCKLSTILLALLFILIVISLSVFIFSIVKAAKREMFLCAALVKQMDATQQAKRKSMNKSHAFATASHDIRASLAAIIGSIEICNQDSNPNSVVAANLGQMSTRAQELLGLLNSVLDTSKIEAGKMQLEEEEFNLAHLLEDVADMFYPMAIKKGVEIVLDPCDGSISKLCLVRGDRGKLKQILCNLLSNAVKFTSEGHITIRAMVQKTSFENAIIASNRNFLLECLCRLFFKNKTGLQDLDVLTTSQQDPHLTEFVIEVDDTGLGIPKDMQKTVFEYYNQVAETSFGQEGTGLGLGIVQSLVRLMGGDIRIVDKETGERGTCFNLNIKLPTCEPESTDIEKELPRMHNDCPSNNFQSLALLRTPSPKQEGSHVVLLIAADQRRKVLMNYIESLNIRVSCVKQGKNLLPHLEKIKQKLEISYFSFSEKTQMDHPRISASFNSDSGPSDRPLCIKDGNDQVPLSYRKTNSKGSPGIILLVIDSSAGPFSELCSAVVNFRKDIHNSRCKVVWLDHPAVSDDAHSGEPPCDLIVYKPFHGSRLFQVLGLIPELKKGNLPKLIDHNSLNKFNGEGKGMELGMPLSQQSSLEQKKMHKHADERNSDKPLNGKKVLVVDDDSVLRKVSTITLCKLGANVEACENGKEGLDQICKGLSDGREGHANLLPYDYILMDCQMPVMDGIEATRLIRKEELKYGIHMPIVALTAHEGTEQVRKLLDAGMDFHVPKPLQVEKLLKAIQSMDKIG